MNYTDEEFYGNKQNTVLENGNIVEAGKQEEKKEEKEPKLALAMVTTFAKTLIILICSIFYIVATVVGLSPKSGIKVFEFIGSEKAALSCYERVYQKSGTLADLYNVVQKSISIKNHNKTSKYIKELQSKNSYNEFCIEVNDAVLQVTEKKYLAYVGDLDGYLVSQNIIAKYLSGNKDEALILAISDLENDNIYSFGLSAYFSCLENDDSLTEEQKNLKISDISNIIVDSSLKVLDKIKERRTSADSDLGNGGFNDKILRLYTSLKIENALLKIYEATNEEDLANQTRSQISELQSEYDAEINN